MQQGLKINHFVLGGCGLIIILSCVTTFFSNRTNQELIETANLVNQTYALKTGLKDLEKILVDAETGQRGFIITKQERYLEPFNKAKVKLNDKFDELHKVFRNDNFKDKKISFIEDLAQEKIQELEGTIRFKKQGKEKELLIVVLSDKGKNIMDEIRRKLEEMLQLEEQNLEERQKQVNQIQNLSNMVTWGSFICIVITVVVVSLAIILIPGRALNRSLQNAFILAEKVSTGDLTVDFEVTSKDVIGKLMATLKNMAQSLNLLIRQVQQSSLQVTSSGTQIASSGKQLEATITEQVASTSEVAAAAKEISATSIELVKTMEEVADMSQSTTIAASNSQKDLLRMETNMRQLAETTNAIAARLGAISENANNINSIVVTISKVADQTNLLSLNAAIEAEKAGEYGLGFAVVAREIRRLADQTAIATLDIEKMVKQMQSSVSTGVMEMDKFATEVGHSVADVARISTQITQIINQVQDLTPRFDAVNQGMEAQSQGAQQISDAMMQLSGTSIQTSDTLREINHAIAQLNQVAQGLRQETARFRVKVEDISSPAPIHQNA
ncbi:methyl-accepting chemotaxis protein [Nostoc sp. T09]|uniref:CHASE3 domain-containing protein n=1 Tax=Nostoc sp. T09 TaxID=1932621 RepID=UPI000A3A06EF|nr:CHASE3 domain-containing protein [Nostoc sp. T09]OUL37545.1 methyl-accepting chemotaxis protein [Nostoc sp. T09]